MVEKILQMECPDNACKKEHDEMKKQLSTARECLSKKVSRSTIGWGIGVVMTVIGAFIVYGLTSFGIVKERVTTNTVNLAHHHEQLIKIDNRFNRLEEKQENMKDDIIKEIHRLVRNGRPDR